MTSAPPTYRALRVREGDPKANGYSVDLEVDGQEHEFLVQPTVEQFKPRRLSIGMNR